MFANPIFCIACVFSFILLRNCSEQILYVSPTGKETSDCSKKVDPCTFDKALNYLTDETTILNSEDVVVEMQDGIYLVENSSVSFPINQSIRTLSFIPSNHEVGDDNINIIWKAIKMKGTYFHPPLLHFSHARNTPVVIMKGIEFDFEYYSDCFIKVDSVEVNIHIELLNCRFKNYENEIFNPTPFEFSDSKNNNITLYLFNVEFMSCTISGLANFGSDIGFVNITFEKVIFNSGGIESDFLKVRKPKDFHIVFRDLEITNLSLKGSFVTVWSEFTSPTIKIDKFQKLDFIRCRIKDVKMPSLGNFVRAYPFYNPSLTQLFFHFSVIESTFNTVEIETPFILLDSPDNPSFVSKFHNVNVTSFSGEGTFFYWSGDNCRTKKILNTVDDEHLYSSHCLVEIKKGYYLNNQFGTHGDDDWGGIFHSSSHSWGSYNDLGLMTVEGSVFEGNTIIGDCGGVISIYNSIIFITNTKFVRNHAVTNNQSYGGDGGALCLSYYPSCDGCQNFITKCIFDSNTAQRNGGGITAENIMNLEISSTLFTKNIARERGGSLHLSMLNDFSLPSPAIISADSETIIEKSHSKFGAGLFLDMDEDGIIQIGGNITLNNASVSGGGVYFLEKAVKLSNVVDNFAGVLSPNMISGPKRMTGVDKTTGSCVKRGEKSLDCTLKGIQYFDEFGTQLVLPLLKNVTVMMVYSDYEGWKVDVYDPIVSSTLVFKVEDCLECMDDGKTKVGIYLENNFMGNVMMKFPGGKEKIKMPTWLIIVISVGSVTIVVLLVFCLVTLCVCILGGLFGGSLGGKLISGKISRKRIRRSRLEYDQINDGEGDDF